MGKQIIETIGAGTFVHELNAQGHTLKSIADSVTERYRHPVSYVAVKRYLDTHPPPAATPSAAASISKANEAIANIGAATADTDTQYWDGILRQAASGLLSLLNDTSANARARSMAGETLVKAAAVGVKQAEIRALVDARLKAEAPKT